jgi:hypothetical protein
MAWRGMRRRPKGSPDDLAGAEKPTSDALLWAIKVQINDELGAPEGSEGTSRVAGKQSPGADRVAGWVTGMIWCVVLSFIWGATALGTLALAKAADLRTTATVTVIALELAGFCGSLLAGLRVRRRDTS